MNITLDYLRGRRIWLVKNFSVWGRYSAFELLFVCSEQEEGSKRIVFNRVDIGGEAQVAEFSSLYDYKGNQVPSEIKSPKVIPLPRNETFCLIVEESNYDFKISRENSSMENGLVDLLIIEMG
jgi:hypothetical protein